MANDSAANDPAAHCQRGKKKNAGTVGEGGGGAKGRTGINFPGEREGEGRETNGTPLTLPTGF